MNPVHTLLVLLGHYAVLAGAFCSLTLEERFPARELPIAIREVMDIAPIAADDYIVVSWRPPTKTDVTRVGPYGEEPIAAIPKLAPADLAESVIVSDRGWWMSRMGLGAHGASLFFIAGRDSSRQRELELEGMPELWLPLRGAEPRGLLVSPGMEQPAFDVDEATPAGVRHLGAFDWWQTAQYFEGLHDSRWSAESLGGGRVAIVGADGPRGKSELRLRVLGGGEPIDATLRCDIDDEPIATAVDGAGRLAIVAHSRKKELLAMIVDPARPESAKCRVISAPGEVVSTQWVGVPALVWTGDDFVAAWMRDDRVIRACALGDLHSAPPIVDVAVDADIERPLRQLIHLEEDGLMFIWRDRYTDIIERRLPRELDALAMFAQLQRFFCRDAIDGEVR